MEKEYIYNPTTSSVDEVNDGGIREYVICNPIDVQRYPLFDGETQRYNALDREEGKPGPRPIPTPPAPGPDPSPGPTPPDPSPYDPMDDPSSWEYDGNHDGVPDRIETLQNNQTWSVI